MNFSLPELPVSEVLDDIQSSLSTSDTLVLEAPPGAGKTTLVPLALLNQPWLAGQKIIVLEPRRIAAKNAAQRMADILGEPLGKTIGYRVRMDTKVSKQTRIEVVTNGVLINQLQGDPTLEGVGLVIFDEFHERSLDVDLALALTSHGSTVYGDLRELPLKLLVMSATLDGDHIRRFLNAEGVVSEGKSFPVEVIYSKAMGDLQRYTRSLADQVSECVLAALADHSGSLLVFLPGQAEINKVAGLLSAKLDKSSVKICPLFGDLSLEKQTQAIQPAENGTRKVVLATDLAESSLTIEGVSVVIDSGLCRKPVYDANSAVTRLQTQRISQASARQRTGRAGRLQSGVCYRLWSEQEQAALSPFTSPEIGNADLSSLVLSILAWGAGHPDELPWLQSPSSGAVSQVIDLLISLGLAEKADGRGLQLTADGNRAALLPVSPRLARMLITSWRLGCGELGCQLAAILSEKDIGRQLNTTSVQARLTLLNRSLDQFRWVSKLSDQYKRLSRGLEVASEASMDSARALPILLFSGFPDRLGMRTKKDRLTYKLSNGRQARLPENCQLQSAEWLIVPEASGRHGDSGDRIYQAEPLEFADIEALFPERISERHELYWNDSSQQFVAQHRWMIGELCYREEAISQISSDILLKSTFARIRSNGLQSMGMSKETVLWLAKARLMESLSDNNHEAWPSFDEPLLLDTLDTWLAPFMQGVSKIRDLKNIDFLGALKARLTWEQQQRMAEWLPERIKVPSGNSHSIDYSQSPPVLALKLQEMFGSTESPAIANGRVKLLVHLLSPAGRPLQVTQDLGSFWNNGYEAVKKEMKGRYPKHPWPDNPTEHIATAKTKRALE